MTETSLDTKMAGVYQEEECESFIPSSLSERTLIIASNRGPITFHKDEGGELTYQRGSGGLVTALTGVVRQAEAHWIACAQTDEDRAWSDGLIPPDGTSGDVWMHFIKPTEAQYQGYYGVIANPLLWFLQHSMWDIFREPTIDRDVWKHWNEGYVQVNMQFAQSISRQISATPAHPLVMLQDYHLYLAPYFVRYKFRPGVRYTMTHFIHIPWPGAEDWGFLPDRIRRPILEGLCAVDLLGVQTREDGRNFLRTCETYLPGAHISFKRGKIWFRNHATYVHDFPISIDVGGLKRLAVSQEVIDHREQLSETYGDQKIILRIDRIEPSKNIVRGFQAFDEMLDLHPEHRGKVKFLALLVPSRLEVDQYSNYLEELMGAAGKVNVKHGDTDWEPVRILVGENYPLAVAAMQIYNVLLVNSIADGMNLVAKEGPIVNQRNGVLVLSERTGAYQQLERGAIIISPLDVYGTAEALHRALSLPEEERYEKSNRLRTMIEREDIVDWLCQQLRLIDKMNL